MTDAVGKRGGNKKKDNPFGGEVKEEKPTGRRKIVKKEKTAE